MTGVRWITGVVSWITGDTDALQWAFVVCLFCLDRGSVSSSSREDRRRTYAVAVFGVRWQRQLLALGVRVRGHADLLVHVGTALKPGRDCEGDREHGDEDADDVAREHCGGGEVLKSCGESREAKGRMFLGERGTDEKEKRVRGLGLDTSRPSQSGLGARPRDWGDITSIPKLVSMLSVIARQMDPQSTELEPLSAPAEAAIAREGVVRATAASCDDTYGCLRTDECFKIKMVDRKSVV